VAETGHLSKTVFRPPRSWGYVILQFLGTEIVIADHFQLTHSLNNTITFLHTPSRTSLRALESTNSLSSTGQMSRYRAQRSFGSCSLLVVGCFTYYLRQPSSCSDESRAVNVSSSIVKQGGVSGHGNVISHVSPETGEGFSIMYDSTRRYFHLLFLLMLRAASRLQCHFATIAQRLCSNKNTIP
jgi:hypothetical protein